MSSSAAPWGRLVPSNARYGPVELVKDVYVVGRHRDCDVKIQGKRISNRHCRLVCAPPDAVLLEDSGSTHGTYVNGRRVAAGARVPLHDLDQIQFALGTAPLDADDAALDVVFVFHDPRHERKDGSELGGSDMAVVTKRKVADHYALTKELGSGNFAKVMLGVDLRTGAKVAVKVIDKTKFWTNPKFFESIEREIGIMMEVQHPNLVRIIDYFDEEAQLFLVLELMAGGELFDRIIDKGSFNDEQSRRLFRQMLLGVKYLHDRGIVHRDLKPENLLLADKSDNLPLKISDFGLARVVGEHSFMKTVCGTPNYLAPDVFGTGGYSKAVDMWSLGVILYIILCGFPPFSDERKLSLMEQISTANFDFPSPWWDAISPLAKDLIKNLIVVDPAKRLTVQQALEHPWMQLGSVTLSQALSTAPAAAENGEPRPVVLPAISVLRPGASPEKPKPAASTASAAPTASPAPSSASRGRGRKQASISAADASGMDLDNAAPRRSTRRATASTMDATPATKRAGSGEAAEGPSRKRRK